MSESARPNLRLPDPSAPTGLGLGSELVWGEGESEGEGGGGGGGMVDVKGVVTSQRHQKNP